MSVHLLHGTWARGFLPKHPNPIRPRWFESNSSFLQTLAAKLQARNIHARFPPPLVWSGSNSLSARYRAISSFREHLERDDSALRIVIAHSHGGNIALRTIATMKPEDRPTGIATLSTPFIVTRKKEPSASEFLMAFSAFFALVLGPFYLFGAFYISGNHVSPSLPTPKQAERFLGALFYTLCSVGLFLLSLSRRMGIVEHAIEISPRVLPDVPLIALRSPGDEASLVLAWGDLLESLNGLLRKALDALTETITVRLIALIRKLEPHLDTILIGISLAITVSGVALIWLGSKGYKDSVHIYLAISPVLLVLSPTLLVAGVFALAVFAGIASLIVTCFASLGYGIEYAAIGWGAQTTCETTPLGATVPVRSIEQDGKSFLSHGVYESDEAIELLADWIASVAISQPL